MSSILSSPIEYLKGVGPQRAELLKKELSIFTFQDLLEHFPFRHVDKTKVNLISDITPQTEYIQVGGNLQDVELVGDKRAKRLVAYLRDKSGTLELVWFQGVNWVQKSLVPGQSYLVYGRVSFFQNAVQIVHPEIEPWSPDKKEGKSFAEPVYPTTEKLKARSLGGRQLAKLTQTLLGIIRERDISENIPAPVREQLKLIDRWKAYQQIHFPPSIAAYNAAVQRLKFEELFIAQLRMAMLRSERHRFSKGVIFDKVGDHFTRFYNEFMPFELTNAQKRVIKEIRTDTGRGRQMNRLLQGDVGSGKTIVAVMTSM